MSNVRYKSPDLDIPAIELLPRELVDSTRTERQKEVIARFGPNGTYKMTTGTGQKTGAELAGNVPFDDERKIAFLQQLSETGLVQFACDYVGVTQNTVTRHRQNDPEFDEAFKACMDRQKERLMAAAMGRVINGVDEPVFGGKDKDQVVGYVKRFPEQLTIALLRRHDPEMAAAMSGKGGNNIEVNVSANAQAAAGGTFEERANSAISALASAIKAGQMPVAEKAPEPEPAEDAEVIEGEAVELSPEEMDEQALDGFREGE